LDLPTFGEVVKSFAELYKIGVKVFDERGTKLADVKVGNGDFCGYVFSFPDGRVLCTAPVGRVKDGPLAPVDGARAPAAGGEPQPRGMGAVPCVTGLRDLVQPITWDGDVLGRMVFGPFLPEDLTELPGSLRAAAPGLERDRALALLSKVQRAPERSVIRVMQHFAQLVETLVAAGQKSYLAMQMHVEATLETNRDLEAQNAKLEAMNSRLKELDRLKSSFLATVSHELRTPLTSIIGYSEMLAEGLAGKMSGEQVEYARTIMEKGETLLKLITSILDISQIEAGKVRLNFEPSDIAEVIHSAVSSVRPQALKKDIGLEVRLPEQKQPRVVADRERLRQVVVNLLANAVKFTPLGGRISAFLSELNLQPELSALGYRIIIEDSGVGIPEDQFERIFQSFYQVDSSSTREFGGAGLGLAIVKSFVEGHGGLVKVASEVGHGSRFTVVLPSDPPLPRSVQVAAPLMPEVSLDRF
ncbi:MAG: PocR ligand-binding domain-containing protein, partial [Rhodospirillales bacterium]|nr:PocR ligand-binding domain-containing protein [Rhodospirillales bacterium]